MHLIPIEAQQRAQSNSCWPVRDESFIASSPIAHVIDPCTAVCVDTTARGRLRHDDPLLESRHPVVYIASVFKVIRSYYIETIENFNFE